MIYGKCANKPACSLANLDEVQEFPDGSELKCTVCGLPLVQEFPQRGGSVPKGLIFAVVGVLLLSIIGFVARAMLFHPVVTPVPPSPLPAHSSGTGAPTASLNPTGASRTDTSAATLGTETKKETSDTGNASPTGGTADTTGTADHTGTSDSDATPQVEPQKDSPHETPPPADDAKSFVKKLNDQYLSPKK